MAGAEKLEEDDYPACIAGRYEVCGLLGQGGMGVALRVRDRSGGEELALKWLKPTQRSAQRMELFEREFHVLAQLAHPRIVQVFDYGRDGEGAYYTMELLDGGDLKSLAPLPWQRACAAAYEVCSALSLLHSRRLVHRDLTPSNIRLSAAGKAKIIDFGLLSPFGVQTLVAGTAPFVAPEVMLQQSLDGRSDLFTFGATLYSALTGRLAFPARRLDQLQDLWRSRPAAPSTYVPDIPRALDDLVLSLLRVDVGSRPKTAGEVMAQLRPLLAEAPDEDLQVASAYLAAPTLVGRADELTRMRKQVLRSLSGRGGGFVVVGPAGAGRSRMLDAFVLDAKLMGAAAARADAADAVQGSFGVVHSLVAQLHRAAPLVSLQAARATPGAEAVLFVPEALAPGGAGAGPQLVPGFAQVAIDGSDLHRVLHAWLARYCRARLVALAVDDMHAVDEASAAWLAGVVLQADGQRLTYAMTVKDSAFDEPSAGERAALPVLRERARTMRLPPLSLLQMTSLLQAVFGDVPNVQGLSNTLHRLCEGQPGRCLALAQHLVDTDCLRYEGGSWVVPATLDPQALPASFEQAMRARVAGCGPSALRVGRVLMCSLSDGLTRAQLMRASGLGGGELDGALDELRRAQLIVGGPAGYALRDDYPDDALLEGATSGEMADIHDALAEIFEAEQQPFLVVAHHRLQGRAPDAALDAFLAAAETSETRTEMVNRAMEQITAADLMRTLQLARSAEERLARAPRGLCRIYPIIAAISAGGQSPAHYYGVVEPWLRQLKHDTGFQDWQKLSDEPEPLTRALKAFGAAQARYDATPEDAQGDPPAAAIKEMVSYVVFSIAVSSRAFDLDIMLPLADYLEPFAPLNPLVAAMRTDAIGAREAGLGRREIATDIFRGLIAELEAMEGVELAYVERIHSALCQAVAAYETAMGLRSTFLERTDWQRDPSHEVGVHYIRKVAALHRGDWGAAEQHRRDAELVALRNTTGSMFSTLPEEVEAHALAGDLTGLQRVRVRVHERADELPGWVTLAHLADAHYHLLCGEPALALQELARARAHTAASGGPESRFILEGVLLEVEALRVLQRPEDALAVGLAGLARAEECERRHAGRLLACSTALAEAELGRFADARRRVGEVIEAQRTRGIRGLLHGRAHEYLARVAIAEGDADAYGAAAADAGVEYLGGDATVLAALHGRLVDDARRAGLVDVQEVPAGDQAYQGGSTLLNHVQTTLGLCEGPQQTARAALTLLCDAAGADAGHLYLLGDEGLSRLASLGEPADAGALGAFASARVELELDDGSCTQTTGPHTGLVGEEALLDSVLDADGQRFWPVMLVAYQDGTHWVLGAALLGADPSLSDVDATVLAVSRHLVQADAFQPVPAG